MPPMADIQAGIFLGKMASYKKVKLMKVQFSVEQEFMAEKYGQTAKTS
jgi:hypothetical protein